MLKAFNASKRHRRDLERATGPAYTSLGRRPRIKALKIKEGCKPELNILRLGAGLQPLAIVVFTHLGRSPRLE